MFWSNVQVLRNGTSIKEDNYKSRQRKHKAIKYKTFTLIFSGCMDYAYVQCENVFSQLLVVYLHPVIRNI